MIMAKMAGIGGRFRECTPPKRCTRGVRAVEGKCSRFFCAVSGVERFQVEANRSSGRVSETVLGAKVPSPVRPSAGNGFPLGERLFLHLDPR